jgi:spermidine/putrescine transport system substrate-binding protein
MEPGEDLSGQISLLDDVRETMGMALRYKGFSSNTANPDEINAARDALIAQKKHVKAYTDSPTASTNLAAGDVIAAMIYTNDAVLAKSQNPDIEYVIPGDVTTVWQDNMVVPTGAPSKYTAEVFINFMLDPQNAADNANFVGSGTTNQAVIDQDLIDEALTSNKAIYPDIAAMGDALEWLHNLSPDTTEQLQRAWDEVKTAQ